MLLDSDRNRIRHMLDAAKKAVSFAAGKQRRDLDSDGQLLFALLRCLEIIGEAAARVSPELRGRHPELPWPKMIGARNRLIHAYFDIDQDIVWQTVDVELAELIASLERLLAEMGSD